MAGQKMWPLDFTWNPRFYTVYDALFWSQSAIITLLQQLLFICYNLLIVLRLLALHRLYVHVPIDP